MSSIESETVTGDMPLPDRDWTFAWRGFVPNELDCLYLSLLHFGVQRVRDVSSDSSRESIYRHLDFLHNIPGLIGDRKPQGHLWFWDGLRVLYFDFVNEHGTEYDRWFAETYYVPILEQMKPLLEAVTKPLRDILAAKAT